MTPLQRSLIFSFFTAALLGLPGASAKPIIATRLFRVAPAVRRIVGTLRQLDIPRAWRQKNWTGHRGQGSCVHAAFVHLLHWQGQHAAAEWWAKRYGDGETPAGLAAKLDAAGLRYAETRSGDESFLRWAIRTRRGAAVVVQNGAHMVNLVGLDSETAHILDSNSPERLQHWPRESFLRDWKESGGWAVTPLLGPPQPPDPWIVQSSHHARAFAQRPASRRVYPGGVSGDVIAGPYQPCASSSSTPTESNRRSERPSSST
jgi:hypothetical protein